MPRYPLSTQLHHQSLSPATADIEALILHVQRSRGPFSHHVELTTEVRIVGAPEDLHEL